MQGIEKFEADFNPKYLDGSATVKKALKVMVEVMKHVVATSNSHIVRNATHFLLESNTDKGVKWIGNGKRVDNNKYKLGY